MRYACGRLQRRNTGKRRQAGACMPCADRTEGEVTCFRRRDGWQGELGGGAYRNGWEMKACCGHSHALFGRERDTPLQTRLYHKENVRPAFSQLGEVLKEPSFPGLLINYHHIGSNSSKVVCLGQTGSDHCQNSLFKSLFSPVENAQAYV